MYSDSRAYTAVMRGLADLRQRCPSLAVDSVAERLASRAQETRVQGCQLLGQRRRCALVSFFHAASRLGRSLQSFALPIRYLSAREFRRELLNHCALMRQTVRRGPYNCSSRPPEMHSWRVVFSEFAGARHCAGRPPAAHPRRAGCLPRVRRRPAACVQGPAGHPRQAIRGVLAVGRCVAVA